MVMIARCYETQAQARGAFDKLREDGFEEKSIALLAAAPAEVGEAKEDESAGEAVEPASGPSIDVNTALRAGGILGEHVEFYAAQLEEGKSVLVAAPLFGGARRAEAIMDEFNPLPVSHMPAPEPIVLLSERPFPMSHLLRMPLLSDQATPVSDFWGLNVLKEGRSILSRLLPELAPGFTFSGMLGINTLSSNATPLSSMANMSTRSDRLEKESSSFGQPLLTRNATPLSSWLNLPLLSKRQHFLYQ